MKNVMIAIVVSMLSTVACSAAVGDPDPTPEPTVEKTAEPVNACRASGAPCTLAYQCCSDICEHKALMGRVESICQ